MFSKRYKILHYYRWFRWACLTQHWQVMRQNPGMWSDEQPFLDKIFGRRDGRS